MSNIINSNAYVKQGDKVYKVAGGANIMTFNSVEEMNAANLPDGTIAMVPVDDEVVDLTGVFDFLTSIQAGGAEQSVSYEGVQELIDRLKRGAVKLRMKLATTIAESYVNADIIGDTEGRVAIISALMDANGVLLYLYVSMSYTTIRYKVMQVNTQPYNPS